MYRSTTRVRLARLHEPLQQGTLIFEVEQSVLSNQVNEESKEHLEVCEGLIELFHGRFLKDQVLFPDGCQQRTLEK